LSFHNNTELVTVVIANYNRCDDLRAAIRSVKEQEYRNIEIVIVDNASRDNSRTMLASEFPDVCVIALDENRGMDGIQWFDERTVHLYSRWTTTPSCRIEMC
jgi:cellulose synthase/poly-beta-1,6-N-acetylglucosamine synthase-like glycosyltransferase